MQNILKTFYEHTIGMKYLLLLFFFYYNFVIFFSQVYYSYFFNTLVSKLSIHDF